MKKNKSLIQDIDWFSIIIPLLIVSLICIIFMVIPSQSKIVLEMIRGFLGDDCGIYYALLGCGIFGCTLYMAFSKFGKIRLGKMKSLNTLHFNGEQ